MNIQLSPLYFLVSTILGTMFCVEFLRRETYKRLSHIRDGRKLRPHWRKLDAFIIVLCVVCVALYFIWCFGGLAVSYFGGFTIFTRPEEPSINHDIMLVDTIAESLQRSISVLCLCLALYQVRELCTGPEQEPRVWKKLLLLFAFVRFFIPIVIFSVSGEEYTVSQLATYLYFILECFLLLCIQGISYYLVAREKSRHLAQSSPLSKYLPARAYDWNLSTISWLLLATFTDLLARTIITVIIVFEIRFFRNSPIAVDLSCILKTAAILMTLHVAYETKIPASKPFCLDVKAETSPVSARLPSLEHVPESAPAPGDVPA